METIYTVNYKGIDVIISELFNERLNKEAYEKIDDSTLNIYVDKISEEFKNNLFFIAYELDYRIDNMKESYPNLAMHNLHYDRNYAKTSCAIFPAYTETRIERYEEIFEAYDVFRPLFNAYDVEEEKPCVHYIVYNLAVGEKEELKKNVKSQNKIATNVNKGVKVIKKGVSTATCITKEITKVMPEVGKLGGSVVEFAGATVNSLGSEVFAAGLKVYNKTITGQYVQKQTRKTIVSELTKAKANTAKLKSLLVKSDEENDLY